MRLLFRAHYPQRTRSYPNNEGSHCRFSWVNFIALLCYKDATDLSATTQ